MATLQELIAQKEALEQQIEKTRQGERSDAIAKIRALMDEYGLTPADVSGRQRQAARPAGAKKVAAKYRDAATGASWSGRGLQPNWLKAALADGRKLSDFAV